MWKGRLKMKYYHGDQKTNSYFEGWYFKCQTQDGTCIALIPAIHIDGDCRRTASIQVITEDQSWNISYPGEKFSAQTGMFHIQIGRNVFSNLGMELHIHQDGIDLEGKIDFGPFRPLKYPIMGPFQAVPNMECSHGVISMKHSLKGEILLNGEPFDFNDGSGYIESDRGTSFPSSYLWAQDVWEEGSLMLSIGEIPMGKWNFTGCICVVLLNGKEHRIATYLGAKVLQWSSTYAEVRQGRYRLELEVLNQDSHPLKAPHTGDMIRTVHESLCSVLRIRLMKGTNTMLERLTRHAGFEFG